MTVSIRAGSLFDENALLDFDPLAQADARRARLMREALRYDDCWVAAEDEAIVGYAIRGAFFEFDFLQLVYVAATHRRRRVGHALVDALECASRGDRLFTSTNETNTAMRILLAQRGYVVSGLVYNLAPNDPELIFVKYLDRRSKPSTAPQP
jgi:GNAT superfamily N-acetyltransferase